MAQTRLVDLMEISCAELNIPFKSVHSAGDIMQTDVRTLTLDHTVKKSLDVMKANRIRHIPVIDLPTEGGQKPFFVGVISQRDILRLKPPQGKEADKDGFYPGALRQLLGQVVTREPKTADIATPITDVINLMLTNRIDMVPVLAGKDLAGIITTTDIVRRLIKLGKSLHTLTNAETDADFSQAASQTVADIMAKHAACLQEADTLIKAIDLFKKAKFRHVLITDESGDFRGIVSDRDILRQLPYAGPRPPKASSEFRADLFRLGPQTRSLNITMKDIMTAEVKSVLPECSVFEAAQMIARSKVSCLPVLDDRHRIRGILTQTDLMRTTLSFYETTDEPIPVRQKTGFALRKP